MEIGIYKAYLIYLKLNNSNCRYKSETMYLCITNWLNRCEYLKSIIQQKIDN
jgi:hypothetical protein